MKKLIVIGLIALFGLSSQVFAQRTSADGRITTRDGRSILRITVGDSRSDRDMVQRVRRLEQAVRDMQDRIYDLEVNDVPRQRAVTTVICSLETSFKGTFIGKASTEIEAKAIAVNKCEKARGGFCTSTPVRCDRVTEYVNY